MIKKNGDLLPPYKAGPRYQRSKYVIIPPNLYIKLEIEAAKRGYKVREFVLAILERAMQTS